MTWDKKPSEFSDVVEKDRAALSEDVATKALNDLLGDEVSLIEKIYFDSDIGKFHSIIAPETIKAKLRKAGYLL